MELSNETQYSSNLLINVAIKSAHCDYERNLCKDWVGLKIVKSIGEFDQRQSMVSKYDN